MNLREYKNLSHEQRKIQFALLTESEKTKLRKAYTKSKRRKDIENAYRSAGLIKVFGAVSGKVYWE